MQSRQRQKNAKDIVLNAEVQGVVVVVPTASPLERRRFEPNGFTPFADGQLNRASDDPAFSCPSRLTLPDKESTIRAKPMTAFVTGETFIVPLSANGGYDHIFLHGLLAT